LINPRFIPETNQRRLGRSPLPTTRAVCIYLALAGLFLLSACASIAPPLPPTQPVSLVVSIFADGKTQTLTISSAQTVREALSQAEVTLSELDRVTPPAYTQISAATTISVTRITEAFETEASLLPFPQEIWKNESLPLGDQRLLQAGLNGAEELTYRIVFEDGVQMARSIVKRVVLTETVTQIIMVGSQSSFTIVPVTGTLAYLSGNNAWVMRKNSGTRLPLTTSGDLDGRIFTLSPDGQWLLFTRQMTATGRFNGLWILPVSEVITRPRPIDAQVGNVLYAEWSPTAPRTFAFSTAESIARAPGWQANNDLWLKAWDETRTRQIVFTTTRLLDSSAGGVYGWWGTGFAFAPDGLSFAYARTDAVGLIRYEPPTNEGATPIIVTPTVSDLTTYVAYNTHGDWAWYPQLTWSPDGAFLYTPLHGAPAGLELPEDSATFDLIGLSTLTGARFELAPRAGMFANPLPSPEQTSPNGETSFRVAFLQAIDPSNSANSRYRLGVMDRDGSNARLIFPAEGQPGLVANARFDWSADGRLLAVIYEGNLWLVELDTSLTQQLTGDGLSDRPAWGK